MPMVFMSGTPATRSRAMQHEQRAGLTAAEADRPPVTKSLVARGNLDCWGWLAGVVSSTECLPRACWHTVMRSFMHRL